MQSSIYERDLGANEANHAALTPLAFIERTASIYPDRLAVVHGEVRRNWAQTYARTRALGSALMQRGIGKGDTVAVIAANIPPLFEAHFGVPMCGAVLNAINTRLDAEAIAFILDHGEAKVVLVDPEFAEVTGRALNMTARRDLLVVDIEDPSYSGPTQPVGTLTYEALLAEGDPNFAWQPPADERDAIALNYTSGTTGNPKGVVYHHRGAHLNALSQITTWGMPDHSVYLWTLPMFHCNGWCFPWAIAANAGTSVCLRAVRPEPIYQLIADEKVTHFCGAPIVLNMLTQYAHLKSFEHEVKCMTAGASPPAAVIEAMEAMGVEVTHVYGLTEVYGPAVVCAWKSEWNSLPADQRARLKARQGVKNQALAEVMVADPDTMHPLPADGQSLGEIFMRGNNVMSGYLKNPTATREAFRGGWFATGDLGVMHPDGYMELKDRSKDIIISGGENISSVEVEDVLYRHPAILEAAVVARPDPKWGETPCAFIDLVKGQQVSEAEIIAFCRENMAHFKAPKSVVLGPLPKTSTGKIQKFILRERAKQLSAEKAG
ncbi:MAG: acyl-CoA synthetase [Neomegalonema sp.]|nr:acyl-CoA synthetase [Neomegalonema sp.]